MKEIAVLEDEIVHLERYLLSLYRTAFLQHVSSSTPGRDQSLVNGISPRLSTDRSFDRGKSEISENEYSAPRPPCDDVAASDKESSPAVSSSSRRDKEKKSIYARHMSLAHHLGNSRVENALVFPDKLSEEIMRCIASIYCKLATPVAKTHNGYSTSSNSSHCSSGTFSPKNSWSPQCADEGGRRGRGGPYSSMLEVLKISLDKESYNYAAKMLQKFRSLVKSLEMVDPTKMSREEKLAFWINIHNALVMHVCVAHKNSKP
ncbi:hypothetical protein M569_07971 [Genlisea aurea]|uniref:DUF547 domain-containing protein n=1 Tax=Genlisea aurea TaxID=192259 RepID=S8CJ98_9LAMI|nr:hypothetical protein M569_07971 [Genlisea aurea]